MFGTEITNEDGKEVLTTNRNVLKLYAEGTVYSASTPWESDRSDAYDAGPGYRVVIPVPAGLTARQCLVFIQPLNNLISPDPREPGRGQLDPFHYIAQTPDTPFKYRVFHPDNVGAYEAPEDWGMEIYGENGEKLFSTRHEIFKVEDVAVPPGGYSGFDKTDDLAHVSVPNAFYCMHIGMMGELWKESSNQPYSGYFYALGFRQESDTVLAREWGPGFKWIDSSYGFDVGYETDYFGNIGTEIRGGIMVMGETF